MSLLLALAAVAAPAPAKPLTPSEIVAKAPAAEWETVRPEDLLVIDYDEIGRAHV